MLSAARGSCVLMFVGVSEGVVVKVERATTISMPSRDLPTSPAKSDSDIAVKAEVMRKVRADECTQFK